VLEGPRIGSLEPSIPLERPIRKGKAPGAKGEVCRIAKNEGADVNRIDVLHLAGHCHCRESHRGGKSHDHAKKGGFFKGDKD